VRIHPAHLILAALATACATVVPVGGSIDEGTTDNPTIVSVDSAIPPASLSVRVEKDAYAVVLLVAPGHSASLLYPKDSTVDNRLSAGTHELKYDIPGRLVPPDSARRAREQQARRDTTIRMQARPPSGGMPYLPPVNPEASSFLLVVTSPQPLVYRRVLDKTAGWSIPVEDMEALNAISKQVKSTIVAEPRAWGAAFHAVKLAIIKN
jgi:hypothetical protein